MKWSIRSPWFAKVRKQSYFIKLFNWEYWPTQAFYYPLIPYFIYLALRARHTCFFTAANAGIEGGGIGFESKYQTILKIPAAYRPITIRVLSTLPSLEIQQAIEQAGLLFPLIAKPDVGYRGLLVKKVHTLEELVDYLHQYAIPFLIQEFLQFPEEVGVLYHRFPNETKGKITSLTLKQFLQVTGNGQHSIMELMENDQRAKLQIERIRTLGKIDLQSIPAKGEVVRLGEIGNHSKGTRFINGNHLINDALTHTFDQLSKNINGFNYGRFDVKCTSLSSLQEGKDFKIIELNGVFSEPTHIYDPFGSTYLGSIKDLRHHWSIIQRVGAKNHELGVPYWPLLKMLRALWAFKRYALSVRRQIKVAAKTSIGD